MGVCRISPLRLLRLLRLLLRRCLALPKELCFYEAALHRLALVHIQQGSEHAKKIIDGGNYIIIIINNTRPPELESPLGHYR